MLFERWTLPEALSRAVVLHDRPQEDPSGLAAVVAVAAAVAARAGFLGPSGQGPRREAQSDAQRALGLADSDLEKIEAEFAERRDAVELICGSGPS